MSHDERIMNVLCANIFSTLLINVTANRQCNYAFQLMKQSLPRPCYLVVVVSRCREMAMTVVMVVVVVGEETMEGARCASVHEASVSVKEKEGGKE